MRYQVKDQKLSFLYLKRYDIINIRVDNNNAFGHGLGDMFLSKIRNTKGIVYIPGGSEKQQK